MILLWLVTLGVGTLIGFVLGFIAKNGPALQKMYRDGFADGRKNLREVHQRMDAFYERVNAENNRWKQTLIDDVKRRVDEIERVTGVKLRR